MRYSQNIKKRWHNTASVKHSENAFNLLGPIRQSNISTQELETLKKQNVLELESVTIQKSEHPKFPTNL